MTLFLQVAGQDVAALGLLDCHVRLLTQTRMLNMRVERVSAGGIFLQ